MAKKVLSIEAGSLWTKVVLAEAYKRSPQVEDLFYFRTPPRAVDDGFIRDRDRFIRVLRDELNKRQITEKNVIFTLNSTKIITRDVNIPMVKDKQLPGIVKAQAKEYFPMDVSNYTITYKKMDEVAEESGKQLRLLLIAVPDNLLSGYTAMAEAAGFSIESFEYIGNSVLSFAGAHYNEDSIIVQLEENVTIVSIIVKKKLMFQRVAPNGYGNTLAVMLDHPALHLNDEFQAYEYLTSNNMLFKRPRVPNTDTEEGAKQLADLMEAYSDVRDSLNYQLRVVRTAIEYYSNVSKKDFFGLLRLVGDGTRIQGLEKLFTDSISLECRNQPGVSMARLTKHAAMEDMDGVDFTSALGAMIAPLAVRPKELVAKEAKRSNLKVLYAALAVSVLISVALLFSGYFQYSLARDNHEYLTRRIEELAYVQEIYDANVAANAEVSQYRAFDALTVTENERFLELLSSLEEQLPATVKVTTLSVSGQSIALNMSSPDKLTTAQLLLNLYEIPFLGDVRVPSMTEGTDALGNPQWEYSVIATYVSEEPEMPAAEPASDAVQEQPEEETSEE